VFADGDGESVAADVPQVNQPCLGCGEFLPGRPGPAGALVGSHGQVLKVPSRTTRTVTLMPIGAVCAGRHRTVCRTVPPRVGPVSDTPAPSRSHDLGRESPADVARSLAVSSAAALQAADPVHRRFYCVPRRLGGRFGLRPAGGFMAWVAGQPFGGHRGLRQSVATRATSTPDSSRRSAQRTSGHRSKPPCSAAERHPRGPPRRRRPAAAALGHRRRSRLGRRAKGQRLLAQVDADRDLSSSLA
jgi:hypothetical protein